MTQQVALVTGVAGAVGTEIARGLGRLGIAIAAVDRHETRLREKAEKLTADEVTVRAFPADIGRPGPVQSVVAKIEDELGEIDFLVNASCAQRPGDVAEYRHEDWMETFEVGATSVFLLSQAVTGRMVRRRRGSVVTVTAGAAALPRAGMAACCAATAAAAMFTRSLGLEVAGYGVRCNVVAPGSLDTVAAGVPGAAPAGTLLGRPGSFRLGIPLGRTAHPTDIAELVCFLLSSKGSYINLQTIGVDGGAALGAIA
ncbi:SDR family oxidoreductase [Actinospica sp. MGRD01-02]|uniref:SDR family oxidoreductase n=1 Tax=Actinospica acidithermotolerans TaxID=2828514 RepID=A0A941EK72_9ACTN|nr:SDR family oxidoreductase [Actinospica acidithermotolerans]MBR7830604.1 SDR family oxidoreductase [Actinospica acidithermotolerans]